MIRLGVTGGIGSGKSTVCGLLESWGARVFYADDEAKRLMVQDPALRREIKRAFGEEAYKADGSLDRAYVADRVFGHPEQLAVLNGLVHPRLYRAFDAFAWDCQRAGAELVVRETALLPAGKASSGLDALVAVVAPENKRLERAAVRAGSSVEDVRRRMEHQLSDSEFRERSDYVIENTGTLEDLEAATRALYEELTTHPPA